MIVKRAKSKWFTCINSTIYFEYASCNFVLLKSGLYSDTAIVNKLKANPITKKALKTFLPNRSIISNNCLNETAKIQANNGSTKRRYLILNIWLVQNTNINVHDK